MRERRNQGVQSNVHKISIEIRTNDLNIQVVTRGGAAIGDDRGDISATRAPWVRKVKPKRPIYPIQEAKTFQ